MKSKHCFSDLNGKGLKKKKVKNDHTNKDASYISVSLIVWKDYDIICILHVTQ